MQTIWNDHMTTIAMVGIEIRVKFSTSSVMQLHSIWGHSHTVLQFPSNVISTSNFAIFSSQPARIPTPRSTWKLKYDQSEGEQKSHVIVFTNRLCANGWMKWRKRRRNKKLCPLCNWETRSKIEFKWKFWVAAKNKRNSQRKESLRGGKVNEKTKELNKRRTHITEIWKTLG